jgi:mono/diheme cytochrome c family protein
VTVRTRPLAAAILAAAAVIVAGCGAVGRFSGGDPGVGKALFKEKCGACHTLADAGTNANIGPNLDAAFAADKDPSFHKPSQALTVIEDVVRGQIAYPESDPGTGSPGMTPNLVHGQDARDVSLYVAMCAANPKCGVTAKPAPGS